MPDAEDSGMKIGLVLNSEEVPGQPIPRWPEIRALAQRAEAVGVDSLWLVDHFLWQQDPWRRSSEPSGVWECWTMLSAVAAATERVELGTLVTCTAYRNPALLAKMASTVEGISGGRLILGLGAGDYPPEREMFGYPTDHPVSRFEEALSIIVPLLRTGEVDFDGEFHSASNAVLRPRGPRASGPPIMIGALAHRPRMLRLVAQYADLSSAWVTHRDPRSAMPEIRLAVDEACLAHGRDPQTLERSVAVAIGTGTGWAPSGAITGRPEEVASVLRELGASGIGHVQVLLFPTDLGSADFLGEVIELI